MIDHRLRNERLAVEAQDPQTAVILLDVVLGYGAHADPASVIAPVSRGMRSAQAAASGRHLAVVGFVCGTATGSAEFATAGSAAARGGDAARRQQCRGSPARSADRR
jgi:FdrA protein